MYRDRVVAVVVPAFREEALIGRTVGGVPEFVDHIVVVDDCSPDATSAAAEAVGDPRLVLRRLERNSGVGAAIMAGHEIAVARGSDIMVVMAGDDQMDPAAMPALLDPIIDEGYGFTKGNRFFGVTGVEGMPKHRVAGSMVLTFLNKAASGYWNLVDPQNGYTALTRQAWEQLPVDKVARRYDFENDLLVWLNIAGVRACDVNIPARYSSEQSTMRLSTTAPRLLRTLFLGFWRRMWFKYTLWSFSPIALLFYLGLITLSIGVAVGLWVTAVAIGGQSPTAGTTVLAVVPFFCGFILLVQALVLDIQETPR